MPTYQYACTECEHAFEQFQSFSDDSLTSCPRCEGRLRKVFNAVGVVFKGSGFYRTDNRAEAKSASTSSAAANGDSSSGTSGEATKSGDKSESKSDSKSEPKSGSKKTTETASASPAA